MVVAIRSSKQLNSLVGNAGRGTNAPDNLAVFGVAPKQSTHV